MGNAHFPAASMGGGGREIEEAAVLGPCESRIVNLPKVLLLQCAGEGTYGKVYRGTCRENNENVAIKKMKMDVEDDACATLMGDLCDEPVVIRGEEEGVPATALREIALLK
eukprot:1683189-Amphidinium_carterae.1